MRTVHLLGQICYMCKVGGILVNFELSLSPNHMSSYTVKPVLSGHSKRKPKISFQDRLSLNAGQKYCRMLPFEHSAILSTFNKLYQWPLRSLFCLFLSGRLRQDWFYCINHMKSHLGVISKCHALKLINHWRITYLVNFYNYDHNNVMCIWQKS